MQGKASSAITKITLNRATFANVPVNELSFVNFFYGNNGAGKSSVARAIAENEGISWTDGKSANDFDVLVYNQDFINKNFTNYGNLKGVFIFGEEDIDAKEKIAELTEQRQHKSDERMTVLDEYAKKTEALSEALTSFQSACFSKTTEVRKRFEKCMDGKKQKKSFADAILAERAPAEHDLAELEQLYAVAFDDSARLYPEFKRAGFAATYGRLPGKELLNKAIVSRSDTPFARFIKALGSAASDWVRDGHSHYSGAAGDKCPYCQQMLPAQFEEDIAATFDAQYQQDIRDLGQLQAVYAKETAEIVRALKASLGDTLPTVDLTAYKEKLALLESSFEINRQRIAEKMKEPSKTVALEDTDTILLELGGLIDDINKFIKSNNEAVSAKRSVKAKCKTDIIQHLAFMLVNDVKDYHSEVARLEKEIDVLIEKEKNLKKEISELTIQISDLNKHNVNTEAAVDSINKILRDSNFQGFSIRAKAGAENLYEIIRENGFAAENLSEGERSFIAFLYFYYCVQGSMNSKELKDKIVVIDDPVSNMDNNALFVVSTIVRDMIAICYNNTEYKNPDINGNYIKQIFILTHNAYFHNEITRKQAARYSSTSFFVIRKTNNKSTVVPCVRPSQIAGEQENYNPVQNSYAALWGELKRLYKEQHSSIAIKNVSRRILNYYFQGLCGFDGADIRRIVLQTNKNFFVTEEDGEQNYDKYHLASALLRYVGNPSGIGNEVLVDEDSLDGECHKAVFALIFKAMGQEQHYKMMMNES